MIQEITIEIVVQGDRRAVADLVADTEDFICNQVTEKPTLRFPYVNRRTSVEIQDRNF